MSNRIQHSGVVEDIREGVVYVRILQTSACSTCSAAQLCKSSESKEKIVEVRTPLAMQYERGQNVMVVGSTQQGLKATLFAYVLPLVVLIAVLLLTKSMSGDDGLSAIAALVVTAFYFFGLYLLRHTLENKFTFKIQNI